MIEFMPCNRYHCEGDEECNEVANVAIVEDGYWHYSATCPNEQHVAEAIRWHIENRDDNGRYDVAGLEMIP